MPQNLDLWNCKQNNVKGLAEQMTPLNDINIVYYFDLGITHINAWRILAAKKRDWSNDHPLQQKQYQAHFAPMTIEKCALTMFKHAGFTPASIDSAAQAGIECACCEICNYPGGKESLYSEPPYLEIYM
eukprot:1138883-Pelagomonas_calceolata.AAC.3